MDEKKNHDGVKREGNQDNIDALLDRIIENSDTVIAFMDILTKMKEAGAIDILMDVAKDYTPTDVEFLAKFFTERELMEAVMKVGNSMMGVLYGLGEERTSDLLKALSFNLPGITDGFVDGVKNPRQLSVLKLLSLLKDPDISAFITGLINALRIVVSSTKKVQ